MKTKVTVRFLAGIFFASLVAVQACKDDPEPTNEEELITTLRVELVPIGGGTTVELEFYDADGSGPIAPVITPTLAALSAETNYEANITLLNEAVTPAENITAEIEEEMDDHLFCFTASGTEVTVGYSDEDSNGYPVGINTVWETGSAGSAGTLTITLRHQPGTKTGDCPGTGENDVLVEFDVQVLD